MTDDYELDAFDMGNSLIHKPRPVQMRTQTFSDGQLYHDAILSTPSCS